MGAALLDTPWDNPYGDLGLAGVWAFGLVANLRLELG